MAGDEWTTMPLDEAVQINPRVLLERGEVYPFVDMKAVDPASRSVGPSEMREFKGSGSRFMNGDTLMARITPCLENGKIARFAAPDNQPMGHGSTEFIVIRGKPDVTDNDFAYYLTRWDGVRQYAISQMTGSSGRQRVPTNALTHLEVDLPPLPEQRAIACILGALDDKIELNRRMNETLEAMARAIFKSWFVDFDPVRAKAEGQQPPGLAPHIADLFPDSFEDSELGEIPKGWKVGCLGDIIEIHDSKRIPLSSRERQKRQGPFPYYGAAGIVDHVDDFLFDGIYVLVGEDGSVVTDTGKPVVQYVWGKFWVNNHAHVLKGTGGISDEYLLLLLQQLYVVPFVTGAVQPKLSQTNMKAIPVVHGSPRVSQVFGDIVRPVFAKIRAMQDEVETLAILRDTLLPRLISGELRLLDAERIVGRCV